MKIGELAKKAQISVQTIHYYEARGILPKAKRTESGYRIYGQETVNIIIFIKHAQDLGFTLAKIRKILDLKNNINLKGFNVKAVLEQEIKEINQKIKSLNSVKRSLSLLNKSCSGSMPVCECPILSSIQLGKVKKTRSKK